jgi:alpha-L-rhamnosidase
MTLPADLRSDYLPSGAVFNDREPFFSWAVTGMAPGRAVVAHQVLVATDPGLLTAGRADCWDSGRVDDGYGQAHYTGRALRSRELCWWTVRVWDDGEAEQEPRFAPPATFELGLFPEDWESRWMGFLGGWYGQSLLMRKSFELGDGGGVRRARAYVATPGWHQLRVNGAPADSRVLEPTESVLSKRVISSCYVLDDLLVPGPNIVGLVLGGGWYGHPCARVEVHVDYRDGTTEVFGTHRRAAESCRVAPGPIIANSPYDGEVRDARLERPGWDAPGPSKGDEPGRDDVRPDYGDLWTELFGAPGSRERKWADAQAVDGPVGTPTFPALPPAMVTEEHEVVRIDELGAGRWVADAGVNGSGWARLRVVGAERGRYVRLRFGETLGPDGRVNQENLRMARSSDVFVSNGAPDEFFEPMFTSHGFRYVEIEGLPASPRPRDIVIRRVRTPGKQRAQFRGEELLERIYANVVRTEASNMRGILTDCPQRDERHGWLNDLTNRLDTAVLAHDIGPLLSKILDDIADSQEPDGSIPDTVPFRWGFRVADPVCLSPVLIPRLLFKHWGDGRAIERGYPVATAWLRYLLGRTEDGVLHLTQFGDWSEPKLTDGPQGAPSRADVAGVENPTFAEAVSHRTPGSLVSTACLHWGMLQLSKQADYLGDTSGQERALEDALRVRKAFRRAFFDPESGSYSTGSQGSLALALALGLVPDDERDHVLGLLLADVAKWGHLTTGNVATKFLLETLTDSGHHDLALMIASRDEYPSWGYMVRHGATTLWERWEESTGGGMNSHNHGMLGSIGSWLVTRHAGLRVADDANGSDRWEIVVPAVATDTHAAADIDTPKGLAGVAWERSGDRINVSLRVPAGAVADVRLPMARLTEVPEGLSLSCDGKFATGRAGGGEWAVTGICP